MLYVGVVSCSHLTRSSCAVGMLHVARLHHGNELSRHLRHELSRHMRRLSPRRILTRTRRPLHEHAHAWAKGSCATSWRLQPYLLEAAALCAQATTPCAQAATMCA